MPVLFEPSCFLVDRVDYSEYFLTMPAPQDTPQEHLKLAAAVAERLSRDRALPLLEKYFGPSELRAETLQSRRENFMRLGLNPDSPHTWIEGQSATDNQLVGAQIWGIVLKNPESYQVTTIDAPTGIRGRLVEGPDISMMYLASIVGVEQGGLLPAGRARQARRMFELAAQTLNSQGFEYRDVVRTWIYMAELLEWYDTFNIVRNRFHAEQNVLGSGSSPFPASTGIQGHSGEEECLMDLLAVRGGARERREVRPLLTSGRQNQAFDYGSAFSRGMSMVRGGITTTLVSGTASIDDDGNSKHIDNPAAQILETLDCLRAVLDAAGAELTNICSGVLYYKDQRTLEAWKRLTYQTDLARLPLLPVHADVCREELLVEIEAIAAVPAVRSSESIQFNQGRQGTMEVRV